MNLRIASRGLSVSTFVMVAAVLMAGCASRSLNPPPVIDRSADVRATPGSVAGTPLYTVRRDDTLASIAKRFNVAPADLAAWNNLGTDPRVRPDQVLRLTPPVAAAPIESGPVAITQPVGNERIEQRPLGSASTSPEPVPVAPAPVAPAPVEAAPPINAPLKTGPVGVKRPYSDAMLAELSRPEAGSTIANLAPTVVAPAEVPKPQDDAANIAWAWPATGKLVATFGEGKSKGIDIAGKAGDAIVAAADGKVIFAGSGARGYGNFVVVRHSPELLSVYAYNKTNLVKEGATVTKGQRIAEMGSSDTDSVKLHFEIRKDSKPVDPSRYLPGR